MAKEVNLPPTGILKVTPTTITLPDNIITCDGNESKDPNKRGYIDRVKFWGDGITFIDTPDIVRPYPYKENPYIARATVSEAGSYTINMQCWDRAGNASKIVSVNIIVNPTKEPMKVGVKIPQAPIREQLNTANDMQCTIARPNSVCVTGNRPLDPGNCASWKNEGYETWVNVAWYENPDAKPYDFLQPADRPRWAAGFETICQKLQGYADGVAIENEWANAVYYKFPVGQDGTLIWLDNYIEQLKIAIPIAHKYGILISDGSVPIEDVELIMEGSARRERTKRVQAGLSRLKGLGLDNVLFHGHYNVADDRNPVKDLPTTIQHLEFLTGVKAFSNELSMEGATGAVITWFLQGCYDAGCPRTMFFSGDGGITQKGDEIVATNDLGKAIVSWQNNH